MKEIALILPNQLFEKNPLLDEKRAIVLLEHPRYFTEFAFHKQKLVFHRASMQEYYDILKKKGYSVSYIEYKKAKEYLQTLPKGSIVHMVDPVDHHVHKEISTQCAQRKIDITWHESPMFLTPREWIEKNFKSKKQFLMHTFYVQQRKRLNILVHNGKPVGGKWSFDKENQEPIPASVHIPPIPKIKQSDYIEKARDYVLKNFSDNPGSINEFIYPTNTAQAKKWLTHFLEKRLAHFGTYQDAIKKDESFLFHSILTPSLNAGLLTPDYVIQETLEYAKKNVIPINSLEGFIRQIIGWREFVRAVYHVTGEEQRNANFFDNQETLPASFYSGKTGIEPIDQTIKKLLKTAYSHHIERLMILGNFMLLAQIKPSLVYTWFMEMYIDSYDWVMVPNVYGMSQYADTRMTTKPYISSSNYILKMSDYSKENWCTIWDGLFWTFMHKNKNKLTPINRMHFMMNALHKKTTAQLKEHEKNARLWRS